MTTLSRFFQKVIRKINKTVSSWFFIDQWVILTAHNVDMESLEWSAFKPIVPPPDRYWGDPFVIEKKDR